MAGKDGEPQKVMDEEWSGLVDRGCFDFREAYESGKLTAASRAGKRKPCHIGLVFGICVEKAFHLDKNDKRRRFKG